MGQKVNPIGLRVGINRTWDSRWFADGDYADLLHEDLEIRRFLRKRLQQAGVSRIVIERPAKKARISIHTARPGVVIGKKGADIEKLRAAAGKDHRQRSASEHSRNPQAGDRCQAGGREHRLAAGAPGGLPPRHEARRAVGHASGRRKAFGSIAAAAWAAPKSPGRNGTAKAGCRCTPCGPMSTTAKPRRRPPMGPAVSRSGSSRAKSWVMTPWHRTSGPRMPRARGPRSEGVRI